MILGQLGRKRRGRLSNSPAGGGYATCRSRENAPQPTETERCRLYAYSSSAARLRTHLRA